MPTVSKIRHGVPNGSSVATRRKQSVRKDTGEGVRLLHSRDRSAFGLGPIFWLLISEIYPLAVRGAAMSAATVANWCMNLAIAVTFLMLVDKVGHAMTFWIYGAITVCAWFFIYKLVPEIKERHSNR